MPSPIIDTGFLASLFGAVFVFAVVALAIGVRRFWRDISPAVDLPRGQEPLLARARGPAAAEATHNVAALTYLDGGHGDGCTNEDDRYSQARRRMHHLAFYGFLLCFAATCAATVYHYAFGWKAPYAFTSLPVMLGTLGGLGLIAGPLGLLWLGARRHPLQGDGEQRPMDRAFIALLLLASVTGLALLAWRDSAAMGTLLAVHLGVVMALFLTLPYGKFAHGVFRSAALWKHAIEKRLPSRLRLGAD